MRHARYDMTIIGGGSGGLTAARIAASLGANVLLIDKERLGGDCLHYGCVPSKSLIHVARIAQQMRGAARLGLLTATLDIDMAMDSRHIAGGDRLAPVAREKAVCRGVPAHWSGK